MKWESTLLQKAQEIMIQGGELRFIVIKRDKDRIPIIHYYPEHQIVCDKEVLID